MWHNLTQYNNNTKDNGCGQSFGVGPTFFRIC